MPGEGIGAPCVPVGIAQACGRASPVSSCSAAAIDGGPSVGAYNFVCSVRWYSGRGLSSVVEDDAQCMALPAMQLADAMAQVRAIEPTHGAHGSMVDGEDHRITLPQRHDLGATGFLRVTLG